MGGRQKKSRIAIRCRTEAGDAGAGKVDLDRAGDILVVDFWNLSQGKFGGLGSGIIHRTVQTGCSQEVWYGLERGRNSLEADAAIRLSREWPHAIPLALGLSRRWAAPRPINHCMLTCHQPGSCEWCSLAQQSWSDSNAVRRRKGGLHPA